MAAVFNARPQYLRNTMAEGPMSVGGQAILEGVMMRSPHSLAIAVRRPNGEIVVKEDAWHSIWEKAKFLRKPFCAVQWYCLNPCTMALKH